MSGEATYGHDWLGVIIDAAIKEQERYEAGLRYRADSAILAAMRQVREDVAAGRRVAFQSAEETHRDRMRDFAEYG